MPELPEVETVKRGLNRLLVGHKVLSVDFDWHKSFPNDKTLVDEFLIGAVISDVRRRAKLLMIDLDAGYSLAIHLKMTGQVVYVSSVGENQDAELPTSRQASFRGRSADAGLTSASSGGVSPPLRFGAGHPTDSLIGSLPDKSTRVTFTLDNNAKLFFNDQRKFGWVRLLPTVEIGQMDFVKKLGPEPLEPGFTKRIFAERLARKKRSNIKAALLDQTVLAGIGNIYADESLWMARIHPTRLVGEVNEQELSELHKSIIEVLNLSIEKGGSTDRNYVNAEGKKGSYISFARVFRRDGQPCYRHPDQLVEKTRVAGRGTHICPVCQAKLQ